MGRITSAVGVYSGIPIVDTVDQLIAIAARPRDILTGRTQQLTAEQVAVSQLTALVIGVEFSLKQLGSSSLFQRRPVESSRPDLITATATGTPATGTFRLTPVRQAQSHQLLSSGFAAKDEPIGAGSFSVRFGGQVNQGIGLEHLNAGAGVERGKIRITDRSGASQIVDLRFAQTVDDVLAAINAADDINVTAAVDGDRLKLIDNTGQSNANLQVQEVAGGQTASDLGWAGINVAATSATGQDILSLYDDMKLADLNAGNGVSLQQGTADLDITLRDGTALQVDFLAQSKGLTTSSGTTEAAHGADAQVVFTSAGTGAAVDGYQVSFVDDSTITAGNETVSINSNTKKIVFRIDAGSTRAVDIVHALNNDATASQHFTAAVDPAGDGTGIIDLADTATTSGGAIAYNEETTLGELLDTINAVDASKLRAQLSASGDSLELVDLTGGSGAFSVSSAASGSAAEDLGLAMSVNADTLTGRRRVGGLQSVLLDSLAGGGGLGELGLLELTDRAGATASVDLSSAETLDDVLSAINAAGISVVASVNSAGNGLSITDTSGGSGNLIVANGDATNTADGLRVAIDDAVSVVDSGSLDLQIYHERLTLASLNHGRGVGKGSFLIKDSAGQTGAVNLTVSGATSVGDVINLVNGLGIGVEARINETGDGLLLVDTAGGSGTLTVTDSGTGKAAENLKIAGAATTVDIGGVPTQVIDGSTAIHVTLDADDTLQDLVTRINEQTGDVAASIFSSGLGAKPFRLALASRVEGAAGELVIDTHSLAISFQETVAAQDSLLVVGGTDNPVAAALVSSTDNRFTEVIDGVTLTVNESSTEDVTVTVKQTEEPVVTQITQFVEQYNKLQDKLEELTAYDETTNTGAVLFGSNVALRLQSDFGRLLTSRFFGLGSIQSLEEVGLSVDAKGRLQFDKSEFRDQYVANPEMVEGFFTEPERGVIARFVDLTKELAGAGNSLLISRNNALQSKITLNNTRIAEKTAALARRRESLLNEYYRLDATIGKIQSNLDAISRIQALPSLLTTRSSN